MTRPASPLISTAELAGALADPDLRLLDASLAPPGTDLDPRAGFAAAHLPGARFFDIDAHSDPRSDLPHMLPTPAAFAAAVQALGIGDGMRVVAYDQTGIWSSARVWWMFRAMGHEEVQVLDGGLPKWCREGRPLAEEGEDILRHPTLFTPVLRSDLLRECSQMRAIVETGGELVLDARPAARFLGHAPEPRAGLRRGHMPGAVNVPYAGLIGPGQTLKPRAELRAVLEAAGVDPMARAVATCGSGISAAIVVLALAELGNWRAAIYDGSWAEWGRPGPDPVVGEPGGSGNASGTAAP